MKTLTNPFFWILFIVINTSCSDIFEPSLEDQQLSIISPADSVPIKTYKIIFWWNEMDDALKYNVQLVAPSFNSVTSFVFDTMVTATKFSYTLNPGRYQWRIRAENGSSQTPYVTRWLIVDTTSIVEQEVALKTPEDGKYFKDNVTFSWSDLFGATSYQLEVDTFPGNFDNPATYKINANVLGESYTHPFENDGVFKWRVRAFNSSMEKSMYSEERTIYIDNTPPAAVTVMRSVSSGTNMNLSWDRPPTSLDVNAYKIYIQKVGIGTDTATYPTVAPYPVPVSDVTTYSFTGGVSGEKFVWRIVAVDKALNEGPFSSYKGFTK